MDRSTTLSEDDLARTTSPRGSPADTPRSPAAAPSPGAPSPPLLLPILGVGLGLSSVSPWARDGISAATFGLSTILWLTFTQLLASAMGGDLAGRLCTRWTDVHADEVAFRDTAHGFPAWVVSSLATAALLTSVIGSVVGGGVRAGASAVGSIASPAGAAVGGAAGPARMLPGRDADPMGDCIDAPFRRDAPAAGAAGAAGSPAGTDSTEGRRTFLNVSRADPLSPEDVRDVGQIVARRTGLSQQAAETRVANVYAQAQAWLRDAEAAAREAADAARKTLAYGALWLFVSLLVGAFVASLAATLGGRRRDARARPSPAATTASPDPGLPMPRTHATLPRPPHHDVPDRQAPPELPVEPDEGPVPPHVPEDRAHDRLIDPANPGPGQAWCARRVACPGGKPLSGG